MSHERLVSTEVLDDAEHQSATDNVAATGAEMGDPEWLDMKKNGPELQPWQSNGGLRGMGTETWNTHDTSLGLDGSYLKKKRLKTYCSSPTDDVTYRSIGQAMQESKSARGLVCKADFDDL